MVTEKIGTDREVLAEVRASLASEPRLADCHRGISIGFRDGDLTMEAELPSVAAKKLALERAAAVDAVTGVVDRLRVKPAVAMGDGEIGVLLRNAFLQETAFRECVLREAAGGGAETVQQPPVPARGRIEYAVRDGVVTLNGEVPGLGHKRLAGVLAWWVPGSRDVINGLADVPPEEDGEAEITDAVRIALEKDPFVDASQIRVMTRSTTVRLTGLVAKGSERHMAEQDAWYVFGVDDVINELGVRP